LNLSPRPPGTPPPSNFVYMEEKVEHEAVAWVEETTRGLVLGIVTTVVSLILVRIGAAVAGKEFSPTFLKPLELWKSFSGVVIAWSQWNEWLLLALSCIGVVATTLRYLWWRRERQRRQQLTSGGSILLERFEHRLQSLSSVSAFAMWTAILFSAFGYQEYLWHVALPVPKGQIGVAFSHEAGTAVPREQLADLLRQAGHEGQIAMRDLPVKFDARDTAKAQQLARRIHAEAVVIYQRENVSPAEGTTGKPVAAAGLLAGAASPSGSANGRQVAYLVFADPSIGVQVPVAARPTVSGATPQRDTLHSKDGVEVPRLEANDVGRLMEAAAGILLYDKDRYLAAIAHLGNALPAGTLPAPSACSSTPADSGIAPSTVAQPNPSNGLIEFYLGNAYSLVNQPDEASTAFDAAIADYMASAQRGALGVQDRLVLAKAYNARADVAFAARSVDCAESLLKQAVALRAPLDRDESALKDPATQRTLHTTFGGTYLQLANVAQYRQQADNAQYWSDAAQKEGQKLMELTTDRRARRNGIWLLYTTGSCESAYAAAQDLLAKKPNEIDAHRLLVQLAIRRDGVSSLEARQHLDAALRLEPDNVPDLLHQLNLIAVQAYFRDSDYTQDAQKTEQSVLRADPNNVSALREYIDLVVGLGANGLYGDIPTELNTGDVAALRTAAKVTDVERWDIARIQQTFTTMDAVRPDITQWAERVAPRSTEPLLYRARLSQLQAKILQRYQALRSPATRDPAVGTLYERIWDQARTQTEAVLADTTRHPTSRQQEQAHAALAELWTMQVTAKITDADKGPARDALNQALDHARAALGLVDANPPHVQSEEAADSDVLLSIYTTVAVANSSLKSLSDPETGQALLAQFGAIRDRWQQAAKTAVQNTKTEEQYRQQHTCKGSDLLPAASKANAAGDHAKALDLARQYTQLYPGDPSGVLSLGWFQYRSGDAAAALATTAAFERAAPAQPYGPANRAVIFLSQGRTVNAQQAAGQALQRLNNEPLGQHLNDLAEIAGDLTDLGRDQPAARDGVRALLASLDQHIGALPPPAHTAKGVEYVGAMNNMAAAAFWAGDYATANRWLELGLAVDGDQVLLRLNHAAAQFALGSPVAALAELNRGIAAADAYLQDDFGQPLQGAQRNAAAAQAKKTLDTAASSDEAWLKQHADLQATGQPLVDALHEASARYAQ